MLIKSANAMRLSRESFASAGLQPVVRRAGFAVTGRQPLVV